MLEALIWDELYGQIPKIFEYNGKIPIGVYRANQVVESFDFPAIFVSFLDPVIDRTNTPLNEILDIELNQNGIEYTKGVVIRQSFDLNIYDNDIRRIAQLQNHLWLWAKKELKLSKAQVLQVNPPRQLDFVEDSWIYRRVIEIVCRANFTWQEVVQTIRDVETSVETKS